MLQRDGSDLPKQVEMITFEATVLENSRTGQFHPAIMCEITFTDHNVKSIPGSETFVIGTESDESFSDLIVSMTAARDNSLQMVERVRNGDYSG